MLGETKGDIERGTSVELLSRERFARLALRLPTPLGDFYADLERAEARHATVYLELAAAAAIDAKCADWQARLAEWAAIESGLITGDDSQLRFHSGPPPQPARAPATATDVKPRSSQRK